LSAGSRLARISTKRTPTRLLRTGTSVTLPYRVGEGIDGPAAGIAHIARPDDRPEQVATATDTPNRERLAEIFVMLFQAQLTGDIEKSENSDSGIDQQTADIDAGISQFSLQAHY
jgi:hypothetical protein